MIRTHLPDLPWEEQHSPTRKFHSFCRNVSLALGGSRNVGTWGGGHPFDVQVRRVPAGAAVCPFHAHLAQWELFLVQSGAGTVRVGDEMHAIRTGDVFVHPPGEPHQLINSSRADLEVLIVADNPMLDAFHYPDSAKWGLRPPGKYFRMVETDYFDGEDSVTTSEASYRPATAPSPTPVRPFAERKIHLYALAWDTWTSPKGKFRGASKELSIALGAQRNTPLGCGGHPFDLELNKYPSGFAGVPFHSHAAQWEMFLILSGVGRVRAGNEQYDVRAGDVVLHPPGEAHQLINPGDGELEFLLIADNPPVDYWHYPDSNKWGLRAPRKFFRLDETEYYAAEE